MVLADVDNTTRLAFNEACEQRYAATDSVMQPLSSLIIFLGVLYAASVTLRIFLLEKQPKSIAFHVCLAQLMYHITHVYIHVGVDMAQVENQRWYNPALVFHFGHQVGTLGAFYFGSWKGFNEAFAVVVGVYMLTGMIYPTIWTYIIFVAWFRTKISRWAAASSLLTLVLTAVEVKMCDVHNIRNASLSTGYGTAFPFHAIADCGQALSIFLQCGALLAAVQRGAVQSSAEKKVE